MTTTTWRLAIHCFPRLGKQGREFLELLLESNQVQSEELFLELEENTALDVVKNDILNLTFGGEFGTECQPTPKQFNDASIQIHVCHSRLREVEVLHDQILHAINAIARAQAKRYFGHGAQRCGVRTLHPVGVFRQPGLQNR